MSNHHVENKFLNLKTIQDTPEAFHCIVYILVL